MIIADLNQADKFKNTGSCLVIIPSANGIIPILPARSFLAGAICGTTMIIFLTSILFSGKH